MINGVRMINWRAYEEHEVTFRPGLTVITGANGVGKTSILEAIAYGLTGEALAVQHRGKLLRDPQQPATVQLSFTVDGGSYLVERSQSRTRAEAATLVSLPDGQRIAWSHKRVTQQIEQLMGVSADFLQRIVYMAEGDVFRFLDRPPGQALDQQIRQVLGLTQLDEFVQALRLAEKELKDPIRELQTLLGDLDRLGVRQDADFERHMRNLDSRREALLADLQSAHGDLARHRRQHEDLERLAQLLDEALPALQRDAAAWQTARQKPIPILLRQMETQATEVQTASQQCELGLARLEGERAARQDVLDVLRPYAELPETLPCPVCGKPMTGAERERAMRDIQEDMDRMAQEERALRDRLAGSSEAKADLKEQVEGLREVHSFLAHRVVDPIAEDASMAELSHALHAERVRAPEGLRERGTALERELERLETERAEYLAVRHRLQGMGHRSPEMAAEALVGLEIRSLSLRAAHRATQKTLTAQRNTDMQALYDQVARVWEVFSGERDWSVQLDGDGKPLLEDSAGRQFDLSQFSGGEKTALLILLHTIVAQHFSRTDFLLIDEPLEHLDPVNRRSLLRFLMGAYRRRSFEQAIVATFEESLIRKYMSEKGVNVIHL